MDRRRKLEETEERLCEAADRLRKDWVAKGPPPPGYVSLLKDLHRCLLDSLKLNGDEDTGKTPQQVLAELEEAKRRVLRKIAADAAGEESAGRLQ